MIRLRFVRVLPSCKLRSGNDYGRAAWSKHSMLAEEWLTYSSRSSFRRHCQSRPEKEGRRRRSISYLRQPLVAESYILPFTTTRGISK